MMVEIIFVVKLLLAGIFGFYFFKVLEHRDTGLKTIISPFYVLFALLGFTAKTSDFLFLFFSGIIWSFFVNTFMTSIDESLSTKINFIWFGLLNIFNYAILERIFDIFIANSSETAIVILFLLGSSVALFDVACYFRKLC